jgi:hypothetical protein
MPAAEVRPTIVVGLLSMMVCGVVDREAREVEARGSCCGSWWKEMELCCGAYWRAAFRGCFRVVRGRFVVDRRSEGGTRR